MELRIYFPDFLQELDLKLFSIDFPFRFRSHFRCDFHWQSSFPVRWHSQLQFWHLWFLIRCCQSRMRVPLRLALGSLSEMNLSLIHRLFTINSRSLPMSSQPRLISLKPSFDLLIPPSLLRALLFFTGILLTPFILLPLSNPSHQRLVLLDLIP